MHKCRIHDILAESFLRSHGDVEGAAVAYLIVSVSRFYKCNTRTKEKKERVNSGPGLCGSQDGVANVIEKGYGKWDHLFWIFWRWWSCCHEDDGVDYDYNDKQWQCGKHIDTATISDNNDNNEQNKKIRQERKKRKKGRKGTMTKMVMTLIIVEKHKCVYTNVTSPWFRKLYLHCIVKCDTYKISCCFCVI